MVKRECLWLCGREADSREDTLPEWARTHLGANASHTKQWHILNVQSPRLVDPDQPIKERPIQAFRLRTGKDVCRTCNNGWMSDLQAKAKSMLIPMLDGNDISLSPSQQAIVRSWAAMTGITLEYTARRDPDWVEIDASRRQHMLKHHSAPPNTLVCLAKIETSDDARDEFRAAAGMGRADDKFARRTLVYQEMCTLGALGVLVLQGVLFEQQARRLSAASDQLMLLKPSDLRWVSWPPTKALSVEGLAELAQHILLPSAGPASRVTR